MLPSLPLGGANESTTAAAAASAANAAAHAAAAAVMNQPVASVQASTETMEQVILDPPGDDDMHMLTLSCLCCLFPVATSNAAQLRPCHTPGNVSGSVMGAIVPWRTKYTWIRQLGNNGHVL